MMDTKEIIAYGLLGLAMIVNIRNIDWSNPKTYKNAAVTLISIVVVVGVFIYIDL
jgi:hypothetical protein|tara:strand:+ start:93 stop:257 length:165 start_codon:yes stop_codon:yes gene_type:complete